MIKKITFFEFQNVISVAKLIDPYVKKLKDAKEQYGKLSENITKLQVQLAEVNAVMEANQKEIDAYESGIVNHLGFHVNELIKKVMVPTGKTSLKTGKPSMEAQYVPTAIVEFNKDTKEYIVTMPDTPEVNMFQNTQENNVEADTEVNSIF